MSRVKTRVKYIEYKYSTHTEVEEIEHRDPSKINIREDAIAFRFFDRPLITNCVNMYEGDKSRISQWYYIGKRLHYHDVASIMVHCKKEESKQKYSDIKYNMSVKRKPYICETKSGKIIYLNPEDRVLEDFEKDKNKENKAILMFKKIKQNLNQKVECTILLNGRVISLNGKLTGIEFFSHIELDERKISFFSNAIAIMSIKCNNEILFNNDDITEKSNLTNENIRKFQADFYGVNVSNKKKYRAIKKEKREEEENKKAKNSIPEIIESSTLLTDWNKRWDWEYYVQSCCKDYRSCRLLKISIQCMKALKEGKSHITVNYIIFKNKLTEEEKKIVIGTVLYFSEYADKIREFFIKEQIDFNVNTLSLHKKGIIEIID